MLSVQETARINNVVIIPVRPRGDAAGRGLVGGGEFFIISKYFVGINKIIITKKLMISINCSLHYDL